MVVVGKKRVLQMKFATLVEELRGAFSAMAEFAPAPGIRK